MQRPPPNATQAVERILGHEANNPRLVANLEPETVLDLPLSGNDLTMLAVWCRAHGYRPKWLVDEVARHCAFAVFYEKEPITDAGLEARRFFRVTEPFPLVPVEAALTIIEVRAELFRNNIPSAVCRFECQPNPPGAAMLVVCRALEGTKDPEPNEDAEPESEPPISG